MASLKELRQVCGKVAWLSGILPKARWVVSVFYKVLHTRLADVRDGREEARRQTRRDTRDKSNMFPVKQLEQARLWLVAYLNSAMENPTKKFKLDKEISSGVSHHGREPGRTWGGAPGEQQDHQGTEVTSLAEGCGAAEVPVGGVRIAGHRGSLGSPGGDPSLEERAGHVQRDIARAI